MIDYRPGSTLKAPHFLIAPPTAAILERRLQVCYALLKAGLRRIDGTFKKVVPSLLRALESELLEARKVALEVFFAPNRP